jgi:hypothetical protein
VKKSARSAGFRCRIAGRRTARTVCPANFTEHFNSDATAASGVTTNSGESSIVASREPADKVRLDRRPRTRSINGFC